jgi:hypothetical protein
MPKRVPAQESVAIMTGEPAGGLQKLLTKEARAYIILYAIEWQPHKLSYEYNNTSLGGEHDF